MGTLVPVSSLSGSLLCSIAMCPLHRSVSVILIESLSLCICYVSGFVELADVGEVGRQWVLPAGWCLRQEVRGNICWGRYSANICFTHGSVTALLWCTVCTIYCAMLCCHAVLCYVIIVILPTKTVSMFHTFLLLMTVSIFSSASCMGLRPQTPTESPPWTKKSNWAMMSSKLVR